MKAVFITCLGCLIGVGTLSAQYRTERQKVNFLKKVTQTYAPDAFQILESEENIHDIARYTDEGTDWVAQMSSLNTVVHETCHSYQHQIGGGWDYAGYFLGEGKTLRLKMGKVYDSYELSRQIPSALKSEIGRYETYIEGDPRLISRQDGIYGLLDEMSAYYHGAKADVEMIDYFHEKCPQGSYECWGEGYLTHPVSTLTALPEFRILIAWYLKHAKNRHPEVYRECMNNRQLRVAFTVIEQNFEDLVETFNEIRKDQILTLNDAGSDVRLEEDGFLMYYKENGSGTGRGTFIPYMNRLEAVLEGELNSYLEAFRIKGVTMQNYAEYL